MAGHFCWCIPVSIGVFLTSFLGLVSSSILGIVSIYILKKPWDPQSIELTDAQKRELTAVALVYSLNALISLFGFIGAVIRQRSFVVIYSMLNTIIFIFHTVFGVWSIYRFFHKDNSLVSICITGLPTEGNAVRVCKELVLTYRALVIVTLIVVFLVHLYICIIIRRYLDQLDEEEFVKLLQTEEIRPPSVQTKSHIHPHPYT